MTFWNKLDFEPIKQYEGYIDLDNLDTILLKSCQLPSFEIEHTEHVLLSSPVKFPGLLKWKPIEAVLLCNTYQITKLNNYLTGMSAVSNDSQEVFQQSIPKHKFSKSTIHLIQNGNNAVNYNLVNCFISSLNYGMINYENDSFIETNITLLYDRAYIM